MENRTAREITKLQDLAYELKVEQAMTRDVISVSPNATMAELGEVLRANRVSGVPVVEAGKMIGIVSTEDLIKSLQSGEMDVLVCERMTSDPMTLYADEPLVHAVSKFSRLEFGRFPVAAAASIDEEPVQAAHHDVGPTVSGHVARGDSESARIARERVRAFELEVPAIAKEHRLALARAGQNEDVELAIAIEVEDGHAARRLGKIHPCAGALRDGFELTMGSVAVELVFFSHASIIGHVELWPAIAVEVG